MMRILAAYLALTSASLSYTPVTHGVLIPLSTGFSAVLAVEGTGAFRYSLVRNVNGSTTPFVPIVTSMVSPKQQYAPYTVAQNGSTVNLNAPGLGSVSLDTSTGVFTLADANGQVLTRSLSAPQQVQAVWHPYTTPAAEHPSGVLMHNDTCLQRVAGDVSHGKRAALFPTGLAGATQDSCCAACNSDPTCIAWVWADAEHPDPTGKNCWPLSAFSSTEAKVGRVLGGFVPPPPPPPPIPSIAFTFSSSAPGARFLGSGTDGNKAGSLSRNSTQALVGNSASWTPSFYCTGGVGSGNGSGWGLLAVSPYPNAVGGNGSASNLYPVKWQDLKGGMGVTLTVLGGDPLPVDLYLYPAPTLRAFVGAQSALEGPAAVPPRYALGFVASRWGWVNASYTEGVLREFRAGGYPLDALIEDFEWYTQRPDYSLPPTGDPAFRDFGFNNVTFPSPSQQLAHYHNDLHVRFGGIRKPRLGNSELLVMARGKGWLMGQGGNASAPPDGTRNLNFSMPECSTWYSLQNNASLTAGLDLLWNDEGDVGADYFTFSDWTRAQVEGLKAFDPARRFLSINRAFAPGVARLGVVVWSGDIHPKWQDLANTPGYVLNWGLAGQPWVTCDIGGFKGESQALLLTRWYGVGVFIPIMRIHSTQGSTPHFPFPELWGEEASGAMRSLLVRRYALLPYLYSLAHVARLDGTPLARPCAMHFPLDPLVEEITSQWMVGEALLVAPVLGEDNTTSPYLPQGLWFEWGTSVTHSGPLQLHLTDVPLAAVPVYAQAGSIVPLAPPLQHSGELPGGPLNVHIYSGLDGTFTLYEDDGETYAYAAEAAPAVSTLVLEWKQGTGCLSWAQGGASPNAAATHAFTALSGTVFSADGSQRDLPVTPIGSTPGKVCV